MNKEITKSIIVAMDEHRVIGNKNRLPWHLPADLKHFKQLTLGHAIIMGRKTYESIGKPLPERTNIVVSRNIQYEAAGCVVVNDLQQAFLVSEKLNEDQVFVIGGANLFEQCIDEIDRIYLTIIHHTFEGDTYFPSLNMNEWREMDKERHEPDEKNQYAYTFLRLERDRA